MAMQNKIITSIDLRTSHRISQYLLLSPLLVIFDADMLFATSQSMTFSYRIETTTTANKRKHTQTELKYIYIKIQYKIWFNEIHSVSKCLKECYEKKKLWQQSRLRYEISIEN